MATIYGFDELTEAERDQLYGRDSELIEAMQAVWTNRKDVERCREALSKALHYAQRSEKVYRAAREAHAAAHTLVCERVAARRAAGGAK